MLMIVGCSIPRDPRGTMDRVERTHTLRLGIVGSSDLDPASRRTLARVLERTDAQPQIVRGDSELLLRQLEEGKLDLVHGAFPTSSPWSKAVHLGSAQGRLGRVSKAEPVPRFAMMNGENGWIMLVAKAGG